MLQLFSSDLFAIRKSNNNNDNTDNNHNTTSNNVNESDKRKGLIETEKIITESMYTNAFIEKETIRLQTKKTLTLLKNQLSKTEKSLQEANYIIAQNNIEKNRLSYDKDSKDFREKIFLKKQAEKEVEKDIVKDTDIDIIGVKIGSSSLDFDQENYTKDEYIEKLNILNDTITDMKGKCKIYLINEMKLLEELKFSKKEKYIMISKLNEFESISYIKKDGWIKTNHSPSSDDSNNSDDKNNFHIENLLKSHNITTIIDDNETLKNENVKLQKMLKTTEDTHEMDRSNSASKMLLLKNKLGGTVKKLQEAEALQRTHEVCVYVCIYRGGLCVCMGGCV